MGSFMPSRGYVGQNSNSGLSFHNVFGNNDTGTPPLLDLSEFPTLNARGNDSMPQSNIIQTPGSKPYGIALNFSNLIFILHVQTFLFI